MVLLYQFLLALCQIGLMRSISEVRQLSIA
ncbi:hypothetical protein CD170_07430 [Staphylococcus aureus]|nr:hypothetical protein CD170_07430 [Staphylococcus aureus]QOJ76178.1 hypothetical protein MVF7_08445 [Staphylococcus aureus]